MTDEMTERSYWDEVRSISTEIAKDSLSECDSLESAQEWVDERLWETIDGHEWIIYTHRNMEVLCHSPNSGYSGENFGSEGLVKDGQVQWAYLAFGALYADVVDRMAEDLDLVWTEDEEVTS